MNDATTAIDDAMFSALAALIDGGFCLCAIVADADGRPVDYRFLRVSRDFAALTGIDDPEGRTALELAPHLDRYWIDTFGRVALGRETVRVGEGRRTAGSDRLLDVLAAPLISAGHFVIVFRDVTAMRRLEEERAHALEHARHLLKELNHRVMNSFAAIGAITAMETRAAPAEARPALQRLQGRVQALGALYRRLDGAARADRIDVADYLTGNVAAFRDSAAAEGAVAVACEVAPLALSTEAAVPLGLIVNELLTNALRHAPATIGVRLHHGDGTCHLLVEDDGPGDPDAPLGRGIGPGLIHAFAGELAGEVAAEAGPGGTRVTVTFPHA